MSDTLNNIIEVLQYKVYTDVKVTETSTFRSIGLDSLDYVEFILKIERTYGLQIPDGKAIDFKTVKDVADYIDSQIK